MNIAAFNVNSTAAAEALRTYKEHRGIYDKQDWEIERIYRQIARGKKVIAALNAIRNGGVDSLGRPKLAIMRADQPFVRCNAWSAQNVVFSNPGHSRAAEWHFDIPWPGRPVMAQREARALLPRIPPQHRPRKDLSSYHILWEADWTSIPSDPCLLKRISGDAWVVLAVWDLTDVELSVLRAHGTQ